MTKTQSVPKGGSSIDRKNGKQRTMGLNNRGNNMMSTITFKGKGPIYQHIFPIELIGLFLSTDWAPYDRVVLTNFRSTFDMI